MHETVGDFIRLLGSGDLYEAEMAAYNLRRYDCEGSRQALVQACTDLRADRYGYPVVAIMAAETLIERGQIAPACYDVLALRQSIDERVRERTLPVLRTLAEERGLSDVLDAVLRAPRVTRGGE